MGMPYSTMSSTMTPLPLKLKHIIQVACGESHSLFLAGMTSVFL